MRGDSLLALAVLSIGWISASAGSRAVSDEDLLPAFDPELTRAELEHHVRFLASDELRGREAGTPDAVRAARYLARAFERAGLEPVGTDGTFLQEVPLVRVVHEREPTLTLETWDGTRVEGRFGIDFDVSPRAEPKVAALLELVVVQELDELPDAPRKDRALWVDGSRSERRTWLGERGMGDGEGWGLCVARGFSRERKGRRPPAPQLTREQVEPDPADILRLHGGLRTLLEEGEIKTVELAYGARVDRVLDFNVVGQIAGTEPEGQGDAIVVSAHYDHIGLATAHESHGGAGSGDTDSDPAADLIFNGADDDASGTAALLELAETLAHGAPPARTVIFLLAAGEEKGLLGTYHYIDYPVFPLERTIANLNLEMLGRPDDLAGGAGNLWLTGFERTTLGLAFQERDLAIVPDLRPEQNFFMRSDNIAFVKQGIVGQTLSSYNLHKDYHAVTDEASLIDFDHLFRCTKTALEATRLLADGSVTPEWLPGGMPRVR